MSNDKVENYLLRLSGEAYNTDLGHVEAPEALFEYYIIVGAKEKAEAERDSLHAENDRLHNAFVDFNLDIERLKVELAAERRKNHYLNWRVKQMREALEKIVELEAPLASEIAQDALKGGEI